MIEEAKLEKLKILKEMNDLRLKWVAAKSPTFREMFDAAVPLADRLEELNKIINDDKGTSKEGV